MYFFKHLRQNTQKQHYNFATLHDCQRVYTKKYKVKPVKPIYS